MDVGIWLILVAVVAVGAVLAWLQLRRPPPARGPELDRVRESTEALLQAQRELAGRVSQLAEQSTSERSELTRAINERLDGVTKRLGDGLEQSATRTARTLGQLTKHLEVIDQAQRNITDLAGQVVGLQDILDNKQARGAFGEVQLNDLVSAILPPSARAFQHTLSNGQRADCLIRLPHPPGPIAIDSKFPLERYHALRAAGDEAEKIRAQREFRAAIGKHIADIATRYIVPGETAESALMFLPAEAVYAELHANFPETVELSYRQRVWIVSPTTLMAPLNTVRAVLKDARMREQAGLIQTEVLKLMEDVGRLDKRVDSLRRHFEQAEKDVREITTSSGRINLRANRIEEVQLEDPVDAIPPPPEGRGEPS